MRVERVKVSSRPWVRRTLTGFAAVLVLLTSLYLLRHPILRGVSGLLTHEDELARADAIIFLSGGEETRPFYAAELYAQGLAPVVAVAQEELTPPAKLGLVPSATSVSLGVLRELSVPDSAVRLLSPSQPVTSTREEAEAIVDFVRTSGMDEIIVVTSPFHTARARYTLRRAFGDHPVDIRMAGAPEWRFDTRRWWESEAGITMYGMEILKWVHTLGVLN